MTEQPTPTDVESWKEGEANALQQFNKLQGQSCATCIHNIVCKPYIDILQFAKQFNEVNKESRINPNLLAQNCKHHLRPQA